MNLVILILDEQHVSFSIVDGHQTFVISVVYASTDYRKRRQLWNFFYLFCNLNMPSHGASYVILTLLLELMSIGEESLLPGHLWKSLSLGSTEML